VGKDSWFADLGKEEISEEGIHKSSFDLGSGIADLGSRMRTISERGTIKLLLNSELGAGNAEFGELVKKGTIKLRVGARRTWGGWLLAVDLVMTVMILKYRPTFVNTVDVCLLFCQQF
jgi:hypothetical protein